jgi:hypothetical protein
VAKPSTIFNGVIAVGALVASAVAVFIAWDQAQIARVQRDASILPAIQIDRFEQDEGASVSVGFDVENAGVGPAFIKSAVLTDEGEPVSGYEHLAGVVPPGMNLDAEQLSGRTIAPGVEKTVLRMRWPMDPMEGAPKRDIFVKTDGLALSVCYCSTLDQCWTARSGDRARPKSVATCPEPEGGLF